LVLYNAPFGFTSTVHLLLQATLLLGLADSSCVLSLRAEPPRSPDTSVWLLRAFAVSIYFWAGLAKMRADWLDGHTLALFQEEGRLRGVLADVLLGTQRRCALAAPAIAFGEPGIGVLLLMRRTRYVGLTLAIAFHLGIEWMGRPDVIGWAMLCLLMVFFDVSPGHGRQ
jgi:hypothetical protein